MKTILFITTNFIWGGSEVLWSSVAKRFTEQHYHVKIISGYEIPVLVGLRNKRDDFFLITRQPPILTRRQRIRQRLGWEDYSPQKKLEKFIKDSGASLVIISQGNNTEGSVFMDALAKQNISFVTITHLVVQSILPGYNDEKINKLIHSFEQSFANFFVSETTKQQHEKFLGYKCSNGQITYNPFIKGSDKQVAFPPLVKGNYTVALIGRLECYHKGYDLLIEVLAKEKWKARNIVFNIYGSGPHKQLIERLIEMNKLTNIILKGQVEDIAEVWRHHHILLMTSRLEGQSLTLIEAMRFKRAAIVTKVGGVEELIDNGINGFIASYPSDEAIDEAMERAWQKRADWEGMGIKANYSILTKHPADATGYFIEQITPFINKKL